MKRCDRNMAGREEDCGRRITYTPCGKPATKLVDGDRDAWWHACEQHASEAESDGCEVGEL